MDDLVIAVCIVITLFYVLFFYVNQLGPGLGNKQENNHTHSLLKRLIFGSHRHPGARQPRRSSRINFSGENVA